MSWLRLHLKYKYYSNALKHTSNLSARATFCCDVIDGMVAEITPGICCVTTEQSPPVPLWTAIVGMAVLMYGLYP